DDEVEPGWLLYWNVFRLGAAQNTVSHLSQTREKHRKVRSIRHESSGPDPIVSAINRGQLAACADLTISKRLVFRSASITTYKASTCSVCSLANADSMSSDRLISNGTASIPNLRASP